MKAKKAMKAVQTQANAKKTRTGRGSRRHRIEESARGVMTLYSCMQGRRFLSGLLAAAAAAAPASAVVRFRGCGGVCGCHRTSKSSNGLAGVDDRIFFQNKLTKVTHNNDAFDREYLHRLHGVLCHGRRQSGPSLVADAAVSTCLCSATEAHTSANSRTYTRVQKRPSRTNSR